MTAPFKFTTQFEMMKYAENRLHNIHDFTDLALRLIDSRNYFAPIAKY
jgi:hypothetical protein